MSNLTVAQIKAEIRAIHGNRTDADTRLNGVINMAQTRITRLRDFDELRGLTTINTVVTADPAADKIISLSSLGRYRKIYSIRLYADNVQSRKLKKVLSKKWDTYIPEPEYYSRGAPEAYTLWGKDQMELWRVPDIVYTMHIRYSRWPVTVTDLLDGTNLDLENVDDLVIHLAASYLFMSFGNLEKSNDYYRIYAALAKEAFNVQEDEFDLVQSNAPENFRVSTGVNDPFVRSMGD
jgi:hypothetical protein